MVPVEDRRQRAPGRETLGNGQLSSLGVDLGREPAQRRRQRFGGEAARVSVVTEQRFTEADVIARDRSEVGRRKGSQDLGRALGAALGDQAADADHSHRLPRLVWDAPARREGQQLYAGGATHGVERDGRLVARRESGAVDLNGGGLQPVRGVADEGGGPICDFGHGRNEHRDGLDAGMAGRSDGAVLPVDDVELSIHPDAVRDLELAPGPVLDDAADQGDALRAEAALVLLVHHQLAGIDDVEVRVVLAGEVAGGEPVEVEGRDRAHDGRGR